MSFVFLAYILFIVNPNPDNSARTDWSQLSIYDEAPKIEYKSLSSGRNLYELATKIMGG